MENKEEPKYILWDNFVSKYWEVLYIGTKEECYNEYFDKFGEKYASNIDDDVSIEPYNLKNIADIPKISETLKIYAVWQKNYDDKTEKIVCSGTKNECINYLNDVNHSDYYVMLPNRITDAYIYDRDILSVCFLNTFFVDIKGYKCATCIDFEYLCME